MRIRRKKQQEEEEEEETTNLGKRKKMRTQRKMIGNSREWKKRIGR